jgi:hypothetical protein
MWAPYWYAKVHQSTGFLSDPPSTATCAALDTHSLDVYRDSLPFYAFFQRYSLGILSSSLCPHTSCPELRLQFNNTPNVSSVYATISTKTSTNVIDPRNENILVWIGTKLLPREVACVSVFDSSVQGGDAVWEGLRVYKGKIFKLEQHMQRLYDSAKALAFQNIPTLSFVQNALRKTLQVSDWGTGQ